MQKAKVPAQDIKTRTLHDGCSATQQISTRGSRFRESATYKLHVGDSTCRQQDRIHELCDRWLCTRITAPNLIRHNVL